MRKLSIRSTTLIKLLERIMEEVEDGFGKLDEDEIWTANSHSCSMLIVSFFLLLLGIGAAFVEAYYFLKWKVVRRWGVGYRGVGRGIY